MGLRRRGVLAAGTALSASALFTATAQATTYTVTATGDSGGSCTNNNCTTLRSAIAAANQDGQADIIEFANGLHGTIEVASPLPITSGGLTIAGPGSDALAISGGDESKVFDITAPVFGTVSISGLTITQGDSQDAGGAILNQNFTALSLVDDAITHSTTSSPVGGGGVFSDGPLTLSGCTLTGNSAPSGAGGAVGGQRGPTESTKYTLAITDSTITGNTARNGGGIGDGGVISVNNSSVDNNQANGVLSDNTVTQGGQGGGIFASGTSLTLTGTTVDGNSSSAAGGGIVSSTTGGTEITDSTINGNTTGAQTGSGTGGGLDLFAPTPPVHTSAPYNPVTVRDSTISANKATFGAGIDVASLGAASPMTIQGSTLSGNQGTGFSFGGGVLLTENIDSPFELVDSTVSGNTATNGGGVSLSDAGYQPLLGSAGGTSGSIAFENSTIAANSASGAGGGIYLGEYSNAPPASTSRRSSSANQTVYHSGVARIASTVVAGNSAAGQPQDLAQATGSTSGGFDAAFSLIQQPGGAPLLSTQSVIVGADPQLGPLANNGGPTQTMLPAGSSPLIDQGHASLRLTTDQRGDPRTVDVPGIPNAPGGDGTDIGAVELPADSVGSPNFTSIPTGSSNRSGSLAGSAASTPSSRTSTTVGPDAPSPPQLDRTADVFPVAGVVFVRLPLGASAGDAGSRSAGVGGSGFLPLKLARQIPLGSEIDARSGTVRIVFASKGKDKGKTNAVRLRGGVFTITQDRGGVVTFAFREGAFKGAPSFAACTSASRRGRHAGSEVIQTLRSTSRGGKFRITGRNSSAMGGGQWSVSERCDGTVTTVRRGTAAVFDFRAGTKLVLRAGQSFLARP